MAKKNGRLNRKSITNSGYSEISPGVCSKGGADRSLRNKRPQAKKLERSPKSGAKKDGGSKRKGKKSNSTGFIYQLVIVSYRSRPLDASNCCGKYVEDAVVGKGLMPDDTIFFCPRPPITHQILVPAKEMKKTEVFLFRYPLES